MNRRMFLTQCSAATMGTALSAKLPPNEKFIWGGLFHWGTNMWADQPVSTWGHYQGEDLKLIQCADHLRFDESVWKTLTERMRTAGMNLVLIDLGESICYPSHPELAVKGSWPVEKVQKELRRLRSMGLEPIPKLNFSTAHDVWLKEYERQVSTPTYYQVCADLIRDVCEIFEHPRWFHLGYDEETAGHQRQYAYTVVRQGDLWWHDFLFFVQTVEKLGMRPWIWSDYVWGHPELFLKRMPKSVLQSNWYYGKSFEQKDHVYLRSYEILDKAGFDQIPTGSNWSCDENFQGTVDFCKKTISKERLKGFMVAPWFFTLPKFQTKNLQAIEQVAQAKKGF